MLANNSGNALKIICLCASWLHDLGSCAWVQSSFSHTSGHSLAVRRRCRLCCSNLPRRLPLLLISKSEGRGWVVDHITVPNYLLLLCKGLYASTRRQGTWRTASLGRECMSLLHGLHLPCWPQRTWNRSEKCLIQAEVPNPARNPGMDTGLDPAPGHQQEVGAHTLPSVPVPLPRTQTQTCRWGSRDGSSVTMHMVPRMTERREKARRCSQSAKALNKEESRGTEPRGLAPPRGGRALTRPAPSHQALKWKCHGAEERLANSQHPETGIRNAQTTEAFCSHHKLAEAG